MSLSFEEERAYRELHLRLDDVRRALRRRYIAWHARFYCALAALVVGATLIACGLFCGWPLMVAGCVVTVSSFVAAIFTTGRLSWSLLR